MIALERQTAALVGKIKRACHLFQNLIKRCNNDGKVEKCSSGSTLKCLPSVLAYLSVFDSILQIVLCAFGAA